MLLCLLSLLLIASLVMDFMAPAEQPAPPEESRNPIRVSPPPSPTPTSTPNYGYNPTEGQGPPPAPKEEESTAEGVDEGSMITETDEGSDPGTGVTPRVETATTADIALRRNFLGNLKQSIGDRTAESLFGSPHEETSNDEQESAAAPQRKLDLGNKSVLFKIAALVLCVIAIVIISILINRMEKEGTRSVKVEASNHTRAPSMAAPMATAMAPGRTQTYRTPPNKNGVYVGMLHHQGKRQYQEDSLGVDDSGRLYIVADGMGGLSSGDKVSQTIVCTMLSMAKNLRNDQFDGVLPEMLHQVTETVNRMLGKDGIYKSGSTLLAVLLVNNRFHWITVGDSHIYLYHRNILNQLNQEHNLGQENLRRVLMGEMTREEAASGRNLAGLTSFIGMGELKYVEKSLYSIPVEKGDRILLMSDGVFNELSESAIAEILLRFPDVQDAADQIEKAVLSRNDPHQDNFSALILGI